MAGEWGNTRHKSHRRRTTQQHLTTQQKQAIIEKLPIKQYVGRPPVNLNGIAPSNRGNTMQTFKDNKHLTNAQRDYYTGIAPRCGYHKPELVNGGYIQLGSVTIATPEEENTRFIEAYIETCGPQFRVLIYADTELVYTIRLIQEFPHTFKPASDDSAMLINGKFKNIRLGRWRSPFHFVDWYWEAVYAIYDSAKRLSVESVVVLS